MDANRTIGANPTIVTTNCFLLLKKQWECLPRWCAKLQLVIECDGLEFHDSYGGQKYIFFVIEYYIIIVIIIVKVWIISEHDYLSYGHSYWPFHISTSKFGPMTFEFSPIYTWANKRSYSHLLHILTNNNYEPFQPMNTFSSYWPFCSFSYFKL